MVRPTKPMENKDSGGGLGIRRILRAVVALIVVPVFSLARGMHPALMAVAVLAALAVWGLGWSPVLLIAAGAAAGIGWTLTIGKRLHK